MKKMFLGLALGLSAGLCAAQTGSPEAAANRGREFAQEASKRTGTPGDAPAVSGKESGGAPALKANDPASKEEKRPEVPSPSKDKKNEPTSWLDTALGASIAILALGCLFLPMLLGA